MAEQNSSISNFKQFLLKILLPLIFTVCVLGIIIDHLFEKKLILNCELCGAYKVHRILTETHADEIPIFGSSRAEGGLIPDSLGTHFFNYGLSGTKYDVNLFFLEAECKKNKSTPWIIIDLDLDGLNASLGDIANYIPDANTPSVKALLGDQYKYYYSVPFIKYYGRFESYTRDVLNNRIQITRFTNKGAALEKNVLPLKAFNDMVAVRKNSPVTFTTDSALLTKLTNFIVAHQNKTFIFVIPPYHPSYFEKYANKSDADALLATLRSYKNVKLLDFGKMPLPDSLFLNTTHVNYKGAMVFSRTLKDSLMAIGIK